MSGGGYDYGGNPCGRGRLPMAVIRGGVKSFSNDVLFFLRCFGFK